MVSLIGLADFLQENWISNHHCLNPLETSAKESTESDMLWLGLSANIYGCFSFDFDKINLTVDTNGNTNKKRPGKVRCLLNFKLVFCTCTTK